jgi:hypothetical protein
MPRFLPSAILLAFLAASPGLAEADPSAAGDAAPSLTAPGGGVTGAGAAAAPGISEHPLLPSQATGQRGVQVRTNVLSGGTFQAGPTIDYRPKTTHPELPAIANRGESSPVELGGFVGYLFNDPHSEGLPSSSLGVDLQFATDASFARGGWLVQPGIDYSTPLTDSVLLNTRLFSTYAPEGTTSSAFGLDRGVSLRPGTTSESGFQDVGVGLGLGYMITDKWAIQTQARYQRVLGAGEAEGDKEASPNQFFGGVMIDYKF